MKTTIDLTREEQLEMENIELRLILAKQEVQRLLTLQKQVAQQIEVRTGIDKQDPTEWIIDVPNGVVRRRESE